ncbi:MAG TPA: nitroreductase [Alphaproteobacteria bacterium]|nr:nitroreductase [Alphaproteobacteria bacterium]
MTDPQPLNTPAPDAIQLLLTRRSGSAKRMTGPGPNPQELQTILRAAARVPDHGKLFPWRFVVFEGEARRHFGETLARIISLESDPASPERLQIERERFLRAPVVVCVVSNPKEGTPIPDWEQMLSAGAVCMSMLTACHALGFVANWITEWPAYHPAVMEVLHLTTAERIAGFIYIGQPVEPLAERVRPDLSELVKHYHE